MKFRNLKITGFLSIMIAVLVSSCEIVEFNFDPISERKTDFLFQTEKTFCKSDPENEIWTKLFKYDHNGNQIETINFYHGIQDSKNTSTFDINNQRLNDSTFYFTESG